MSLSEPTELLIAVHFDSPARAARLISINGEEAHAKWLPKSQTLSFHLTGKTTRGKDRDGKLVTLPMAHVTVPEWLAKKEGLI